MSAKQIILTSSGLKNVVLSQYQNDEEFIFVFGEQELRMKTFFAEFISPVVSRLHQADPTINTINFGKLDANNNREFQKFSKTILTPEIISLINQISSGFSIEINEEQAIKLRFLSNFLGNEELYEKLNESFPQKYSLENVNSYLNNLECCYHFSHLKTDFDFASLLSFVSSHFDSLDQEIFLKLPRSLQHQIISNPKLQIESEDSLFDIVAEILEMKKEKDEIEDVLFLEQIEFSRLSDDRIRTFVDLFDVNEMNGQLWHKLSECFFDHCDRKSKQTVNKHNGYIIVSGCNKYNHLGANSNNKDEFDFSIISPPLKSSLDPSSLLSFSVYYDHSVVVTSNGSLLGIGNNKDGRISNTLAKAKINQFTEFLIKDKSGSKLSPLSAVCTEYGTLYMLSKSTDNERQLVYCDCKIKGGSPSFLDIGDSKPVALFGGKIHTAAINDKGEVIFINRNSLNNSSNLRIEAVSLPDGEKASSVACCDELIVVLSLNGRVFSSSVKEGSSSLKFSAVNELASEKVVCIAGTGKHCFAVCKDGRVFGCGSNENGKLGFNKSTESVSSFTLIQSLQKYKITAAYAGGRHSLFKTHEGKILACGNNQHDELIQGQTTNSRFSLPVETIITEGATFCIAGGGLSAVFIDNEPPLYTPNMKI